MAARSIASLTVSFGLVSIPVKLYSATESAGGAVKFNLLSKEGHRLKQQYVDEQTGQVVPRAEMSKGYEFEKDRFVLFTPEELKALEDSGSHLIEIVSFIPAKSIDPTYYDKAYLLAPDKRGGKPYRLLQQALQDASVDLLVKLHDMAPPDFLDFDAPGDTALRRHVAHTRAWYDWVAAED